jgi:ABC-type phosphate/phosphonate transport system substrate-binding protein
MAAVQDVRQASSRLFVTGSACCAAIGRLRWRGAASWFILSASLVLILLQPAVAGEPTFQDSYRFGVFPYLPTLSIDRIFGPMAASFAEDLAKPVELRTKTTFEKFADELSEETYDVIFVHPFFYVDAADKHDYLPLARLNEPLTAVLMVRQEQSWQNLHDLAGKVVALPPALAAVSELTKAALADVGLEPGKDVTLHHYRTKHSCLQAVVMGAADACAVPRFVLSQIPAAGQLKLRPLAETAAVNHFVFAVHARVPARDRETLRHCILNWPNTPQGRNILAIGAWKGFVEAYDEDYDPVRAYNRRLHKLAEQ